MRFSICSLDERRLLRLGAQRRRGAAAGPEDLDGLLFADMERRTLHSIRFDTSPAPLGAPPWRALGACLAVGYALGLVSAVGC